MSEKKQPTKKGPVEDNLTCPLCSNAFREPTTIRSCLHTFCKECIHAKFDDDDCSNCPVCNAQLGINPKDKLRCDNNLQNLTTMLLTSNSSKEPKPKTIPKILAKKKKKSLSSIAPVQAQTVSKPLGTPKSVAQKSGRWEVARNTCHDINANEAASDQREVARKFCHDRIANETTSDQKEIARKTCYDRDANESNSDLGLSSKRSSRGFMNKKVSDDEEPHKVADTEVRPQKHVESTSNSKQEINPWEQLTVLTDTAKKTSDSKVTRLGFPAFHIGNDDKRVDKSTKSVRMKRKPREFKSVQNNNDIHFQSSRTEGEALQPSNHTPEESIGAPKQNVADLTPKESNENSQKTQHPVWLALQGCGDRKGKTSSKPKKFYIKVEDRNMPVSYVQKYLKQKLNLKHESEVELSMCGQTLVPEVTLYSLVDTWVFNLGDPVNFNSVEKAMMVLTYRRN